MKLLLSLLYVEYITQMPYHLLVLSLPTENATARMRAWRALKACGAGVLRDGVYILPADDARHQSLLDVAAGVRDNGGTARVLSVDGAEAGEDLTALFDRSADYAELIAQANSWRAQLDASRIADTLKAARKLRKSFEQTAAIDFFATTASQAQAQARTAIEALEAEVARATSPGEPRAVARAIQPLARHEFQGRTWATRARPWVDRLASAWLIRRFIDPAARFLWLADIAACPSDAIGFDFDGATFSHVGARVTFETLLASFGLETPALLRLGVLVHGLDAGGILPAEAAGVERVLDGFRDAIANDDELLTAVSSIFNALLATFQKEPAP